MTLNSLEQSLNSLKQIALACLTAQVSVLWILERSDVRSDVNTVGIILIAGCNRLNKGTLINSWTSHGHTFLLRHHEIPTDAFAVLNRN